MKKQNATRIQLALFISLATFTTGQSFLLVVLPPLGRQLGFTDIHIGGILSLSALLIMISAPFWGHLSEHLGRRPILLIALTGAIFSAIGFATIIHLRFSGVLSAYLGLLFIAIIRATQAATTSGILPAAQAYMADITSPEQRASGMGILGAAIGVGVIIGGMLAWGIAGSNPILAFIIIALLATIAVLTISGIDKEPVRKIAKTSDARLPLSQIYCFLAITLLTISSYSIVQQVSALRLQDTLGFTTGESISRGGAALMATALAMVLVQAIAIRFLRLNATHLLGVGGAIATVAMLICTMVTSYMSILGALIFLGIGLGLMLTGNLTSLSLHTSANAQGKAAGINVVAQGLGQSIGPITGASLYHVSPQTPFLAATIMLALAWGVGVHSRNIKQRV